jgi:glycosyltransferase involved in cell wall biosynthesis
LRRLARSVKSALVRGAVVPILRCLPALGMSADRLEAARRRRERSGPIGLPPPRADAAKQLFLDISELAVSDAGTGIQRVVRQVLKQWLASPPAGWRVEPVYSAGAGLPWRYARRFAAKLAGRPRFWVNEDVIRPRSGDVFLAIDLHTSLPVENESLLVAMRERGVRVCFALYDLLPVRMPSSFTPGMQASFDLWLRTVSKVADGVVAISRACAEDFIRWLDEHPPQRNHALDIGYFQLGADLPNDIDPQPSQLESDALRDATARPALLMVGTLEPRKAHAQALDAMELLWQRGAVLNLVIAGKAGWLTEALAQRLREHAKLGHRLFWFDNASDAFLAQLYSRCTALLAPSQGEGFGLPLVEAAQHGLPIIARDLPVFREVAGDHAFYFSGVSADELASAIERWLSLHSRGEHPKPDGLAWADWQRSAGSLEDVVLNGRWLRRWGAWSFRLGQTEDFDRLSQPAQRDRPQ